MLISSFFDRFKLVIRLVVFVSKNAANIIKYFAKLSKSAKKMKKACFSDRLSLF